MVSTALLIAPVQIKKAKQTTCGTQIRLSRPTTGGKCRQILESSSIMNKKHFTTLVSAVTLGFCVLASTQASAAGPRDNTNASNKHDYVLHNGKRDPFTDGARVYDRRDPFTDGARVNDRRNTFTDGAHGGASATLELAGRDLTGVSASPAHNAAADGHASA